MKIYGMYFRFIKWIIHLFRPARSVPEPSSLPSPAVYVVRHQNMRGPLFSVLWFPGELRIWVLHVFCGVRDCFRQLYGYTYSERSGAPKPLALLAAAPISLLFANLMRSGGVIPVYRASTQIRKTMSRSLDALKKGESIIIFPDVDYVNEDEDVGEIYTGFLQLERFYYKAQKEHLPFVPLSVDSRKGTLTAGEPVCFRDGEPFTEEKLRVTREIRRQLNEMAKCGEDVVAAAQ